ncbi:NTF2-like protein [Atractiella rhizophila]|nr:NTF2-like protein [Atractiella rhizophila]
MDEIALQMPLTRLGIGPGLIILLSEPLPSKELLQGVLEPLPPQKWAEEGFAVASILCTNRAMEKMKGVVEEAVGLLKAEEKTDGKMPIAMIAYGSLACAHVSSLNNSLSTGPRVLYAPELAPLLSSSYPTLAHIPSLSSPPSPATGWLQRVYTYPTNSTTFMIPSILSTYDRSSSSIAHSRSLDFVKRHVGGPYFDLEKVWEEHILYEFSDRAVEETMNTMVEEPYVNHIPTMTGGVGRERLTAFYRDHFIFSNPPDTQITLVSRTIGGDRLVDEMIFSFTHSEEVPWMLPGVAPTGKPMSVPLVAIVCIRGDKLYNEHIYWDQASVLMQLGLLNANGLPVVGVDQAKKLVDESLPSNTLIPSTSHNN